MLQFVITSLALAKKRRMREIIPSRLMDFFEEWELRILVSFSLAIQVVLIVLGNRRKKISHAWIRVVVWTAYLSADAVAIYALGITSREIGVKGGSIDPATELKAFWAPFLLMHLGGPDTITANSLEDNELWLRHCLSLFTQTVATLYVLFLSWSGSYLSWLYIVILICGLIKYADRVWTLWAASSEQFRDSTPERQRKISKTLGVQKLKEAEGHIVVPHEVMILPDVWNNEVTENWHNEKAKDSLEDILIARGLIDIFRPAFTDLLLTLDDLDAAKSQFEGKHHNRAYNIIAIELGFIYDTLFTKAMVSQTQWGFASRVATLILTSITLFVFTFFNNKVSYGKIDRDITFALLGVAFFLELYASLVHLFSDNVACWLANRKYSRMLKIINRLDRLDKRQRWSNKIGQFNLLSYSLKENHLRYHRILEYLGVDENVEKLFYTQSLELSNDIKHFVYHHLKGIPTMYKDLQSIWEELWGKDTRRKEQLEGMKWSTKLEFDVCILVWHIATHICMDGTEEGEKDGYGFDSKKVGIDLSRYMLYLLVRYPYMLPAGIGRMKFRNMHATVTTLFEEHQFTGNGIPTDPEGQKCCPKKMRLSKDDACKLLLEQVNTQLNLAVSSEDKSKFVLFHGCQLASQLSKIDNYNFRWETVKQTWIAMLALAALKCNTSYHLQQLKRGGELLTHVWLLMVHDGLTDHFQIPHGPEIAELNIK